MGNAHITFVVNIGQYGSQPGIVNRAVFQIISSQTNIATQSIRKAGSLVVGIQNGKAILEHLALSERILVQAIKVGHS